MKKYFLALVAVVLFSTAYSQGVSVGLKGGLNFPTVDAMGLDDGIQSADRSGSSGYHVGAFARFKVSKIAIQPELLYSFQSIEYDVDLTSIGGGIGEVRQDLSYLTLPIMLRLYLAAGLNLQVGPQFGFFLNGENAIDAAGITEVRDAADQLKGTDIGLNVGAGFDLPFGLDIHARYTIGLSDVNESSAGDEAKNSMIQVSLGYALVNLGRN